MGLNLALRSNDAQSDRPLSRFGVVAVTIACSACAASAPHLPRNGRLPQATIQQIVRRHFAPMRTCYEAGLSRNPELRGRVATKFVIGIDGHVTSAVDGGSDLPDPVTLECIQATFTRLVFPPPEGGSVTVVYPVIFSPGEPSAEKQPAAR